MTKNDSCTKYLSERQEWNVAKACSGHRTPMSGAGMFLKADVVTPEFAIECKTKMTASASFSIKKEWLDKLEGEAWAMGKPKFALAFNFGGEENQDKNYYIIDQKLFKELLNAE